MLYLFLILHSLGVWHWVAIQNSFNFLIVLENILHDLNSYYKTSNGPAEYNVTNDY